MNAFIWTRHKGVHILFSGRFFYSLFGIFNKYHYPDTTTKKKLCPEVASRRTKRLCWTVMRKLLSVKPALLLAPYPGDLCSASNIDTCRQRDR